MTFTLGLSIFTLGLSMTFTLGLSIFREAIDVGDDARRARDGDGVRRRAEVNLAPTRPSGSTSARRARRG